MAKENGPRSWGVRISSWKPFSKNKSISDSPGLYSQNHHGSVEFSQSRQSFHDVSNFFPRPSRDGVTDLEHAATWDSISISGRPSLGRKVSDYFRRPFKAPVSNVGLPSSPAPSILEAQGVSSDPRSAFQSNQGESLSGVVRSNPTPLPTTQDPSLPGETSSINIPVQPNISVGLSKLSLNTEAPILKGVEVASTDSGEPPAWDFKYQIGGGATGNVFLEMIKSHGNEFPQLWAVKRIPRNLPNFTFKRYQAEIHNLQALATHEWFVKFYSAYADAHNMYIAMEYMPIGDMSVTFADGYRWNEIDTKVVIKQLLSGLSVMHKEGITHRDLKPENIFLYLPENQKFILRVKIGDFGTSKRIRHSNASTYLKTTTGTQSYMAPEVQDTSRPKTNKVDIWSIGCILYRMVAGCSLFKDPFAVWKYAASADSFPKAVENIGFSAPCIDFLCDTLQPIPEDRPSAEASLQTPWIINEVEKLDYTIGEELFTRLSEINLQAPNVYSFSDRLAGLVGCSPDTERTNG